MIVGIDFGTTHSLISYIENGSSKTIEWLYKSDLLPSAISYSKDCTKMHIGFDAIQHPLESGLILSIKRLLVEPNQHVYGKKTPVDIVCDILRYMKKRAEEKLGRLLSRCVMTVPAYFDDNARNALKTSAEFAGWKVVGMINEPTAAALAYGLDNKSEGIYAIYDFGGGTFDTSILKMTKDGVFKVLSTKGDINLGGDDIENAVCRYFYENQSQDLAKCKRLSRSAKEEMSYRQKWTREGLIFRQYMIVDISMPFIDKTIDLFNQAIQDAGVDKKDIKAIVMVGGTTRLFKLKEIVKEKTGIDYYDNIDPDCVVAIGAAHHAHALEQKSNHLLIDVNALSLGVETMGGIVEKIIPRNSSLPITAYQDFTTYKDGQTAIGFNVVQGERELAKDCRSLGKFTLKDLPVMRAGSVRVRVTFNLDISNMLTVTACEKETGKDVTIQIQSSHGLKDEDINRMIFEADQHGQDDIKIRLDIQKKLESQKLIKAMQEAWDDHEINQEERLHIKQIIDRLKNEADFIDEASEIFAPIALKRLQRALSKKMIGAKV